MIIPIYAETGKKVGHFDTSNFTYYTIRDYKLNQIFWKKDFGNAVGISKNIIKELIRIGLKYSNKDDVDDILKEIKLRFTLLNFDKETVAYEISLFDFLKNSVETFFAGKENADRQRRCALKHFYKVDLRQKKLK